MKRLRSHILLIVIILLFSDCGQKGPSDIIEVYFNDFETENYPGLSGVVISEFDGDFVIGNFNNSGFELRLKGMPDHDFIRVSFDLYIHDSWDGNANNLTILEPDHDAWIIEFDADMTIKPSEKIYYETTFSNGLCIPAWCYNQSYPNQFPFVYDARTQASSRQLNGLCLWQDTPNGTSLYRIEQVFPHKRNSALISFYDRLRQPDSGSPKCDESWSLDNLSVHVLTTD